MNNLSSTERKDCRICHDKHVIFCAGISTGYCRTHLERVVYDNVKEIVKDPTGWDTSSSSVLVMLMEERGWKFKQI